MSSQPSKSTFKVLLGATALLAIACIGFAGSMQQKMRLSKATQISNRSPEQIVPMPNAASPTAVEINNLAVRYLLSAQTASSQQDRQASLLNAQALLVSLEQRRDLQRSVRESVERNLLAVRRELSAKR